MALMAAEGEPGEEEGIKAKGELGLAGGLAMPCHTTTGLGDCGGEKVPQGPAPL